MKYLIEHDTEFGRQTDRRVFVWFPLAEDEARKLPGGRVFAVPDAHLMLARCGHLATYWTAEDIAEEPERFEQAKRQSVRHVCSQCRAERLNRQTEILESSHLMPTGREG